MPKIRIKTWIWGFFLVGIITPIVVLFIGTFSLKSEVEKVARLQQNVLESDIITQIRVYEHELKNLAIDIADSPEIIEYLHSHKDLRYLLDTRVFGQILQIVNRHSLLENIAVTVQTSDKEDHVEYGYQPYNHEYFNKSGFYINRKRIFYFHSIFLDDANQSIAKTILRGHILVSTEIEKQSPLKYLIGFPFPDRPTSLEHPFSIDADRLGHIEDSAWTIYYILSTLTIFVAAGSFFVIQRRIFSRIADLHRYILPNSRPESPMNNGDEIDEIRLSIDHFIESERNIREEMIKEREMATLGKAVQVLAHDLKGPLLVIRRMLDAKSPNEMWEKKTFAEISLGKIQAVVRGFKEANTDLILHKKIRIFEPLEVFEELREYSNIMRRTLELDTESYECQLDHEKVARIISNLGRNAIEAASNKARLRIYRDKKEHSNLVIETSDDGPGIPDEITRSIYERGISFGKRDGTGLGLYFTKQVVLAHGGKIDFTRQNNLTIFKVTLMDAIFEKSPIEHSHLRCLYSKKSSQNTAKENIYIQTTNQDHKNHLLNYMSKIDDLVSLIDDPSRASLIVTDNKETEEVYFGLTPIIVITNDTTIEKLETKLKLGLKALEQKNGYF